MNIFEKFNNYRQEKRLARLEVDLKMINQRYEFNPYKFSMPSSLIETDQSSKRLVESFVWYSANIKAIREYYKGNSADVGDKAYFWASVPNDNRKVHSGLPLLISRRMAVILFGNGFNTSLKVYKDDQEQANVVDDVKSKRAQDLLTTVITDERVNLMEKIKKGAKSESWSGHVAFKLSHDISISPYPILEVADKRSFEVIKNRGITTAIVFKTYYNKKEFGSSKEYVLHEIYTVTPTNYVSNAKSKDGQDITVNVEPGTSMIRNELYWRKSDGKLEQVDLTTLKETESLEPTIIYYGLKGMLALEKPNLDGDGEFADSIYGVSDYQGAYSTYDALDEIISEIVAEIRDNKTLRYYPDVFLQRDKDGNFIELDKYITNFVVTHDSNVNKEGHKAAVETTQIADKTADHYEKYKVLIAQACSLSGLSVISLGIPGMESISSSNQSTRERTKTTTETRKDKIKLWTPFIQNLLVKMMQLTSWIQQQFPESILDGIPLVDIDYGNCDVKVNFNDYIVDSTTEKINTWSTAKTAGVASTEMAVRKIHGDDMTESDIIDEVNRIKFEQGMAFDTPDSLLLTGEEDLKNDKVEDKK
jgi:hypothetical protein